jgi:hypothetical protein
MYQNTQDHNAEQHSMNSLKKYVFMELHLTETASVLILFIKIE